AAADHLHIDAPAAAAANAPFTVTVAAQDPFGNTAAGYRGTIRFTSSDTAPGVQLPADYPFTATDAGVHTFTRGVTLITTGSQTLSVADTGSTSLSVDASLP